MTRTAKDSAYCHDLAALRAEFTSFKELMNERDRRYTEGQANDQRAVSAALVANEKLTSAAFAASKEAIIKAEDSQRAYNATHNDLTRKMDRQYETMLPRDQADERFAALEEKIADLRESRSSLSGRDEAVEKLSERTERLVAVSARTLWSVLGIGVTVVLFVIGNLLFN